MLKKWVTEKRKRRLRRFLLRGIFNLCLLGTAYFLGAHHKVIEAKIRGEELPAAPGRHCCK